MENPDNEDIIIQIEETLHLFLWPNNITTSFPFPVMFYWPCADHVLLFVDDVVTSWSHTKISDWSEIKCIVILAVQNRTCSIPKCIWYRVIALFTLYFLVYDTSIMILALPCNRGLSVWYWGILFWAVYHMALESSCNIIYSEGQYHPQYYYIDFFL
jgi:hypothetical protein